VYIEAVARNLSAGFGLIRKPGRLPYDTHSEEHVLEYTVDRVEIHKDAIQPGDRVLMVATCQRRAERWPCAADW